jgi:hypothetical protein
VADFDADVAADVVTFFRVSTAFAFLLLFSPK